MKITYPINLDEKQIRYLFFSYLRTSAQIGEMKVLLRTYLLVDGFRIAVGQNHEDSHFENIKHF